MTNKPMLSVERELLVDIYNHHATTTDHCDKLRALLNKQSCGACGGCANGCKLDRESPLIEPAAQHHDSFNGNNKHLVSCIEALLALDAKGALSHGVGGHARAMLEASAARLTAQHQGEPVAWEVYWADNGEYYFTSRKRERAAKLIADPDFKIVPLYAEQPAPVAVVMPEFESAFEAWWESDGQYCRAGGGSYEKTFAYRAYEAALAEVTRLNTPQ